jgi:hypothetical protein
MTTAAVVGAVEQIEQPDRRDVSHRFAPHSRSY